MKTTTIKLTRTINAPLEMVFNALTQAAWLSDWFCRDAHTEPRQGGSFRVSWWSGYEAHGTYTNFVPPRAIGFTWLGKGEPGETKIRVTLTPAESATRLTLTHTGFGTGKKWAGQAEGAAREWNRVLDNLKSVLETGVDLRDACYPRLGINFETAKDRPGVCLTEIAPGSPAETAGLQKGDVLVKMKEHRVRNEQEFGQVFRRFSAGQRVPVAFVRAGKRRTVTVELGARPLADIPDDPAEAAKQVRASHDKALASLRAATLPLTDKQAARAPAEGQWSVKQTLAHLCASERGFHSWTVAVLSGNDTQGIIGIVGNLPEQLAVVIAAAPTVSALIDRFERDLSESRALVAALTPEHRACRVRYRRIAQMLFAFLDHTAEHVEQAAAAARAVRQS